MAFVPDQWITVFVARSSWAKAIYAIRDWPNPGSFIFLFFVQKVDKIIVVSI